MIIHATFFVSKITPIEREPAMIRHYLAVAVFSLFAAGALAPIAAAEDMPRAPSPQLSAQGEGYVEAVPDIVVIDVTVTHTAKTLAEAKQAVDEIGAAVLRAADLQGIKTDDLQASKIQAAPDYDWQNGQRTLRGQQVTRQFQLRLRDIDRYGALIQALADAQVTQINGIHTEFSRQEQLESDALKKAIANVRAKADAMAAACNSRVVGIATLTEGGAPGIPAPYEMRADFAKAQVAGGSAGTALKIGKQRITKTVSAVFTLENPR
jgi:uncharacterized protein YggE